MKTTVFENILADLIRQLEINDNSYQADLASIDHCTKLTFVALNKVQEQLQQHSFDSPEEEIHFFKHLKPQLDGRMLYYTHLRNILNCLPPDQIGKQQYYHAQIKKFHRWLRPEKELYLYYQLDYTHFDSAYFLRSSDAYVMGTGAIAAILDRHNHTPKSFLFASFFAFDLIMGFVQQQLASGTIRLPEQAPDESITWTGTQAELTELMYALREMAVLNKTRMEISKLTQFFEKVFNVNLGNVYKTYENMRLRKRSRTLFLDNCIIALQRRYDHDDEHAL